MVVEKNDIPLYNELEKYINSNPTVFHMPGHKMGRGLPDKFLSNIGRLDLTEIPGTDNLHNPEGVIKEAQNLAAEAFGAMQTFFLVNGSTCGIHAMILSACKKGDKLIVPRDCHKSVISAMLLAGVDPIFVTTGFDELNCVPTPVEASSIEQAFEAYPEAVGVLITRPNYYGLCCDIKQISKLVHSKGKVLLVDEAHGAHFAFHEGMPATAMSCGADICVQSAHKTLPALTQSALLHVGSKHVDLSRLKFYLSILQTSSPSYILMASMDMARNYMSKYGYDKLDNLTKYIEALEWSLKDSKSLLILGSKNKLAFDKDKTRIVVNVSGTGSSGYEFDKLLRLKHNIQVEMSDFSNIVCICTVADEEKDLKILSKALIDTANTHQKVRSDKPGNTGLHNSLSKLSSGLIYINNAFEAPGTLVPFREAWGKVSRSTIVPYPPGIPVIVPGEQISQEVINYVEKIMELGGEVQGLTSVNEIDTIS